MAQLKKSDAGKSEKAKTILRKAIAVTLPMELSTPSHDINDYNILIHGEKKIGKTTLATIEGKVFLLTFDPLQKAHALYQRHCPTWAHFMAYLIELEKTVAAGKFPYTRVVVDGADIWFRRCQDNICKKLVIDHPSEEKWGKAWDLLKSTFANAVDRLMALPCGSWFISHSTWKEIETRKKGVKVEKLLPLIKAGGEDILVGRVDGWFAYDYVEKERVLIVKGDERTGAGHRIKGHFTTPKGRTIREVPMGTSEEESWSNLLIAFNNKQTYVDLEERDKKKGGKGK